MIKAYFFDWMSTLGDADERKEVRDIIKERGHHSMLMNRFEDAEIPEEYRDFICSKLNSTKHILYPDSEKVISELSPKYKLAIISNIYDISLQKVREYFPDFIENFDMLTWSCEAKMKKPDPNIFIYTLKKLNEKYNTNIMPREVVMIGDKMDKDIEPALRLGMRAKLINRKCHRLEDVL